MSFKFHGSSTPTIGVEIELQILDPETLALVPQSEQILQVCKTHGIDRIKAEVHQSMLEIDSEIASNVKECYQFLKTRLKELTGLSQELGLQLAVLGTHPFQKWTDHQFSNRERYQSFHKKFRWLARRMNIYGLHVHVGVESGEHALAVMRGVTRYLPHLLALSANSPFWQGIDTGMQSSRVNIIEAFPYGGLSIPFASWRDFEYYYKGLHRAGAIRSLKDFYWYVRPNLSFGTIEFRICDAISSLEDTMAVVALIHSLVVFICQRLPKSPAEWQPAMEYHWIAPENQWIAARDGLNGSIITNLEGGCQKISDSILELIEKLSPTAKQLNCYEELLHLNHLILQGNGAQRQRQLYRKTKSLEQVVRASIENFITSF